MDIEHFKKTYLPLQNKLFRFALRFVKDPMAAEDVVQEVFLRIWKKRIELADLEKPEAYCMTMTRNMSFNYLKGKNQHHADLDEVREPAGNLIGADKQMEANERMIRIQKAIKTLSERQQLVIHLREVEELTYDEIAEILEISLAMVKSELFRARQHLKVKLEKYERR
ncbi:MAG: RNA polymerase sigma factor [Saprospiraceae bacterium]|nr:RNA polymerase sigma factor [Saprospiraceae bacterium]